jgi:exodeoxyribonuclease V alpha subunit
MLEAPDAYDIAPRIAKMLLGGAAAKYHPLKDSQVLAAGNMGPAGVHALNERLQALLNPPEAGKAEALVKEGLLLRVGDKVMQTSNDYERALEPAPRLPGAELTVDEMLAQANKKGVFNGDVGYIESIAEFPAPGKIRVKFDEGTAEYSLKEASTSLALSYVCTVHKFQGSEAPLIFFVMHESTSIMLRTRNLVYTAITRAKSKCLVMGSENVLRAAVKRDALEGRKTRLCGLIDGSIAVDATATPSILALSEKQGFAKLVDDHAADLKAGQAELEFGASASDGPAQQPVDAPKKRRAKAL